MGSYPALAMPWPPDSPGPQPPAPESSTAAGCQLPSPGSPQATVPHTPPKLCVLRTPVHFAPHSPCFCTPLLRSVWNVLLPLSDLLPTGSHLRILLLSSEFSWVFLLSPRIGLLREGSNKMVKKGRLFGVLCPKHPPFL